jgi:hypothetical protein
MEPHDRIRVGVCTERLELDEAWSFAGKRSSIGLISDLFHSDIVQ